MPRPRSQTHNSGATICDRLQILPRRRHRKYCTDPKTGSNSVSISCPSLFFNIPVAITELVSKLSHSCVQSSRYVLALLYYKSSVSRPKRKKKSQTKAKNEAKTLLIPPTSSHRSNMCASCISHNTMA